MRSGNQWNVKSTREFTPVQENSNEDELAGLPVWLPDSSERGAGRKPGDRSRSGTRWRDIDRRDNLERGDQAGAAAGGDSSRRSSATRAPHFPDAETGAPGAGLQGGAPGRGVA